MQSGRQRLRDWIRRSKLTQREAADVLDITEQFLSQILSGVRTLGLANAIKFEDVTGIPVRSWQITERIDPSEAIPARVGKAKS